MEDTPLATIVIDMLKKSVRRLYVGLIIMLILFIISIVDSIYQRERIKEMIMEYQRVEEVSETYEVDQDAEETGNNNFVVGNNNEVDK